MKTTRYLTNRCCANAHIVLGYVLEGLTIAAEEGCSVGRTHYVFLARLPAPSAAKTRILRVVYVGRRETVHNAFFDRGYREQDK